MELFFNSDSAFTRHVVAKGLLEEPFVVVDVGVLGGEHPRWHLLGDYLIVHGFDAGDEAIRDLENQESSSRSYHHCAIGDADGEQKFFYNTRNPTASSFFPAGNDRFARARPDYETRRVPVRSLDSLVAGGVVPAPDFLKVDVEGYEMAVFRGAAQCVATRLLGVEFETNLNVGPDYPHTHLGSLQEMLLPEGFVLFDLNFNRVARASFDRAREAQGLRPLGADALGRPATFDVLFCRDPIAEADSGRVHCRSRQHDCVDRLLKQVMILELYGLIDVAFDTVARFRNEIGRRIDPDLALKLLLASSDRFPGTPRLLAEKVAALEQEARRLQQDNAGMYRYARRLLAATSRRLIAPLRAVQRVMTSARLPGKAEGAGVNRPDQRRASPSAESNDNALRKRARYSAGLG